MDEADIERVGRDPDAFERFYREHLDAVLRFVVRRVDDPWLAADLTADVFLAVIDAAGTYRSGKGRPVAWLYGIARNVVAEHRRRLGRERRATSRVAGRRLIETDDIAALEARIDAEAKARDLYRAMEALAEGERAVLELVALDGLSVGQAAQALHISTVNGRVRLHRARRRLRSVLTTPVDPTTPSEASL